MTPPNKRADFRTPRWFPLYQNAIRGSGENHGFPRYHKYEMDLSVPSAKSAVSSLPHRISRPSAVSILDQIRNTSADAFIGWNASLPNKRRILDRMIVRVSDGISVCELNHRLSRCPPVLRCDFNGLDPIRSKILSDNQLRQDLHAQNRPAHLMSNWQRRGMHYNPLGRCTL